jgi:hypothetical protein
LTIDDDVAAVLERLRDKHEVSLKVLVNEALRRGLQDLAARQTQRDLFRTRSVDLGRLKMASIDHIAEVLAIAEGESLD